MSKKKSRTTEKLGKRENEKVRQIVGAEEFTYMQNRKEWQCISTVPSGGEGVANLAF